MYCVPFLQNLVWRVYVLISILRTMLVVVLVKQLKQIFKYVYSLGFYLRIAQN